MGNVWERDGNITLTEGEGVKNKEHFKGRGMKFLNQDPYVNLRGG